MDSIVEPHCTFSEGELEFRKLVAPLDILIRVLSLEFGSDLFAKFVEDAIYELVLFLVSDLRVGMSVHHR